MNTSRSKIRTIAAAATLTALMITSFLLLPGKGAKAVSVRLL